MQYPLTSPSVEAGQQIHLEAAINPSPLPLSFGDEERGEEADMLAARRLI